MITAAQIVVCGWLLVLAALAAVGAHRSWLLLPLRVIYSAVQLVAFAGSLGRLKLSPAFSRASARRVSAVDEVRSWRTRASEERDLLRGETPEASVVWTSAALERGDDDVFDSLAPPPPALKPHKGDDDAAPQTLPEEFR